MASKRRRLIRTPAGCLPQPGIEVYNNSELYTLDQLRDMRTNIEIDDGLLEKAQRLSGLRTKRAVVEAGLQILVRLKEQGEILRLAGKVHWEGDLDQSRRGRER